MREHAKLPPMFGHPELVVIDEGELVDDLIARLRKSAIHNSACPTMIESKQSFLRVFPGGASRNDDADKIDPEGFISPLVLKCYCEYLHTKRRLKDGSIRESDNWQRGMPKTAWAKSLWRHFLDFHLHHRGFARHARAPLKKVLCAILFNTMGYLAEILKEETNDA